MVALEGKEKSGDTDGGEAAATVSEGGTVRAEEVGAVTFKAAQADWSLTRKLAPPVAEAREATC
jgi:hypothetical protein